MIYTRIEEGKRHLYITAEGTDVPSADDVELTYKDGMEKDVDIDDYKFFYNANKNYQQIRASKATTITDEDIDLNVYAGDDLIIGRIVNVEVKCLSRDIANATVAVNDTEVTEAKPIVDVIKGTDAIVTITPDEGYSISGTPTISVDGGEAENFTVEDDVATFEITALEKDATIEVDATIVED